MRGWAVWAAALAMVLLLNGIVSAGRWPDSQGIAHERFVH